VDDLTAWQAGTDDAVAPSIAGIWRLTGRFAQVLQLTVNHNKSCVVAAPAQLRERLRQEIPGATVAAEAKDLGVLQQAGRRPAGALLRQRIMVACDRLRRVAAVPLPRPALLRVAAAAGVAVAVYGAACGAAPAAAIATLRAAAACAVSRSGRYGAPELRLLLGDPTCRADPAAAFATAPLMMLATAVRRGLVSPGAVAAAFASATARVGPICACKRALAIFGLGDDPLEWRLPAWRELPAGAWRPASEPLASTRRLLWELWRGRAVRAVAARRSAGYGRGPIGRPVAGPCAWRGGARLRPAPCGVS